MKLPTNAQKIPWAKTLYCTPRCHPFGKNGIKYKMATDNPKPITPPNLLGILRRIAYANKKYHSG